VFPHKHHPSPPPSPCLHTEARSSLRCPPRFVALTVTERTKRLTSVRCPLLSMHVHTPAQAGRLDDSGPAAGSEGFGSPATPTVAQLSGAAADSLRAELNMQTQIITDLRAQITALEAAGARPGQPMSLPWRTAAGKLVVAPSVRRELGRRGGERGVGKTKTDTLLIEIAW